MKIHECGMHRRVRATRELQSSYSVDGVEPQKSTTNIDEDPATLSRDWRRSFCRSPCREIGRFSSLQGSAEPGRAVPRNRTPSKTKKRGWRESLVG